MSSKIHPSKFTDQNMWNQLNNYARKYTNHKLRLNLKINESNNLSCLL